MSTSPFVSRRVRRAAVASVAVALFWAALASTQPPGKSDLLDQARRREEVARQKIEADVRSGLQEVQKLTASNPVQAIERLNGLLAVLLNDTALAQDRRERLQRMVKDRIRVTELDKEKAVATEIAKDDKQAITNARRLLDEQQAAERERLRREIEALKQQKPSQAAEVARRNPTNPAATAGSRIIGANDQIKETRKLDYDRQRALAGVRRDTERSAMPAATEWELPRDWVERTKGRTSGLALSVKERAILSALSSPVLINFKNSRFDDVIEYLSTLIGQPILIEPSALKEAEVTYETPVTLNAKGVTARTALRRVLAELGLSYIIKDETIQVTSLQRARETMVVRSYPIADLVVLQRPEFGQFGGRPVTPLEVQKNVEELLRMIQNSVDQGSWQVNGGLGTIAFHAPSNSLLIKQTAEVHMMLGKGSGPK